MTFRLRQTQNFDNQNVDNQNVDNQNVEKQNVDNQKVDNQNVDTQNFDSQNVDKTDDYFDCLCMCLDCIAFRKIILYDGYNVNTQTLRLNG